MILVKKTVKSAGSSTVKNGYCRLRPTRRSWKSSRSVTSPPRRRWSGSGPRVRCPPATSRTRSPEGSVRDEQVQEGLFEGGTADLQVRQRAAVGEQRPQRRRGVGRGQLHLLPVPADAGHAGQVGEVLPRARAAIPDGATGHPRLDRGR